MCKYITRFATTAQKLFQVPESMEKEGFAATTPLETINKSFALLMIQNLW